MFSRQNNAGSGEYCIWFWEDQVPVDEDVVVFLSKGL